ncbi:MAG: hypothetical protein WAL50_09585 [Kineosporiaceae bacterium]
MFLALTCLPVLVTPFVAHARDHQPAWGVTGPLGLVLVVALTVLMRGLPGRTARDEIACPPA